MIWVVIAVLGVGTLAFKVLGPLVAGGAQPPAALGRVIELMTPALLGSLVVATTFEGGGQLVVDARVTGVLVGFVLLVIRMPLLVALTGAATTAAVMRALGW